MVTDGIEINTWSTREPDAPADARAHRAERLRATFAEIYPDAVAPRLRRAEPARRHGRRGCRRRVSLSVVRSVRDRVRRSRPALRRRRGARVQRLARVDSARTAPDRLPASRWCPRTTRPLAACEAERAVGELGFRGVFLRPNPVDGRNFDDPAYDPLWSAIERLGVPRPPRGRARHTCRRPGLSGSRTSSSATSARIRWSRCRGGEPGLRRCARALPRHCGSCSSKPAVAGCRSGSSAWTSTTRTASSATTARRGRCRWRRASTSAGSASCGRRRRVVPRSGDRRARRRADRLLDRLPASGLEVPRRRRLLSPNRRRVRRQQGANPVGQPHRASTHWSRPHDPPRRVPRDGPAGPQLGPLGSRRRDRDDESRDRRGRAQRRRVHPHREAVLTGAAAVGRRTAGRHHSRPRQPVAHDDRDQLALHRPRRLPHVRRRDRDGARRPRRTGTRSRTRATGARSTTVSRPSRSLPSRVRPAAAWTRSRTSRPGACSSTSRGPRASTGSRAATP